MFQNVQKVPRIDNLCHKSMYYCLTGSAEVDFYYILNYF